MPVPETCAPTACADVSGAATVIVALSAVVAPAVPTAVMTAVLRFAPASILIF